MPLAAAHRQALGLVEALTLARLLAAFCWYAGRGDCRGVVRADRTGTRASARASARAGPGIPARCLGNDILAINGDGHMIFDTYYAAIDAGYYGRVRDGRTGLLGVACEAGASIPACERVAAAVAYAKDPPVQRLSRGSGACEFARQRAAVDGAPLSKGPRHAEGVPDARGRQNCAHAPTLADRAEDIFRVIMSWLFLRFVIAATHAHEFVLGELRRGLLGVALPVGGCIYMCERVAAAAAWEEDPPVERLARGSGTRAFVRQRAAVDDALPSIGPRHGELVPDARSRQGCAHVPAAADRGEGVVLVILF